MNEYGKNIINITFYDISKSNQFTDIIFCKM